MIPVSKSQKRALALFGLPPAEHYAEAAHALEALDCCADGIPNGHTWRSAAKLSDVELVAGLKREYRDDIPSNLQEVNY